MGPKSRDAEGVEGRNGEGASPPQPTRWPGAGERRKLPQRGPGRTPRLETGFAAFWAWKNTSGDSKLDIFDTSVTQWHIIICLQPQGWLYLLPVKSSKFVSGAVNVNYNLPLLLN